MLYAGALAPFGQYRVEHSDQRNRATYLTKVRESAHALAKDGYLLPEDIERIVARAAKFENGAQ